MKKHPWRILAAFVVLAIFLIGLNIGMYITRVIMRRPVAWNQNVVIYLPTSGDDDPAVMYFGGRTWDRCALLASPKGDTQTIHFCQDADAGTVPLEVTVQRRQVEDINGDVPVVPSTLQCWSGRAERWEDCPK